MDIAYSDRLEELILQARIGWAVAGISLLIFAWILVRLGRRISAARISHDSNKSAGSLLMNVHRSESATASMEYLMVIVPFLVIVMTVWQLAFMLNAHTHVGYAVFAAARSAAVIIPSEMDGEEEGKLSQKSNAVTKWTRINRAAIPGTLAVSPGSAENAFGVATANALTGRGFGVPQSPDLIAAGGRSTLMSMHMCDTPVFCGPQALKTGTRAARLLVKDLYAQNMTRVYINGKYDNSDLDLTDRDIVTVRVDYVYWLHVPYVGRMLQAAIRGWRNPLTGELIGINPFPSIVLSEETSINVWSKKRATEPCD